MSILDNCCLGFLYDAYLSNEGTSRLREYAKHGKGPAQGIVLQQIKQAFYHQHRDSYGRVPFDWTIRNYNSAPFKAFIKANHEIDDVRKLFKTVTKLYSDTFETFATCRSKNSRDARLVYLEERGNKMETTELNELLFVTLEEKWPPEVVGT